MTWGFPVPIVSKNILQVIYETTMWHLVCFSKIAEIDINGRLFNKIDLENSYCVDIIFMIFCWTFAEIIVYIIRA